MKPRRKLRTSILETLSKVAKKYGGHLPHDGREWSACLECRLIRLIRDVKDRVVLMPTRD